MLSFPPALQWLQAICGAGARTPTTVQVQVSRIHRILSTVAIILVIFRIVCPPEPGAKAEIGELDVPHLVNEDVVRLDVPVDEPHLMNAVHGADKFTDIKLSQVLLKDAEFDEKGHEIATRDIVHHKIQIQLILEGVV